MMKRLLLATILLAVWCSVAAVAQTPVGEGIPKVRWESYQDEAVRLLQEYLRIDTSNPPGNELKAADFFSRVFDDAGIPSTVYPYAPGRTNIYAILKGDGSERPLVFLNHMDVVHANSANWRVPPFSGEIVDGEIYGRGALDMKDEGLLQAMAMVIAAREHLPLKRDLIFLATSDEEVGDTGSAWILEHHPELVRDAEYLITEGGSNLIHPGEGTVYGIGVAEKAPFWLRLTARGQGGHGSIPIADSATNRLVRALARVVNWQTPVRLIPAAEEYFHAVAPLQPEPRASEFRNIRSSLENPAFVKSLMNDEDYAYLLHDTVSLTVLKGGPQTNVIPASASADLDVRLLPGTEPKEFLDQLRKVVADDQIEIDPLSRFRTPNASSTDTALYRAIEQVVHQYPRRW
jgi:acetylornithine deacetylase/succinyl-diaminopimelate desuccinylase-like protein